MKFRNRLLLLVSLLFLIFYMGLIIFNFLSFKSNSFDKFKERNLLVSKSIVKNIKQFVIENDLEGIKNNIESIQNIEPIKNVKLNYYRLMFNSKTLINSMKRIDNHSLVLGDITIDAKYGDVRSLGNGFYEINPTKDIEYIDFINVKFQIQKTSNIADDYFPLTFKISIPNKKLEDKSNWFIQNFMNDIDDILNYSLPIKYLNNHVATISLEISSHELKYDIYNVMSRLFIVLTIFIFIVFILTIWLLQKYAKIGVIEPITYINTKLNSIHENNYKFSEEYSSFKVKEISILNKQVDKIARKVALNLVDFHKIQNLQSKSMFKDYLTNLGNKTLLNNELKNIFVSHKNMYIARIELNSLKELMSIFNKEQVDNFLIEFSNMLNSLTIDSAYRLFGGEFYILFKNNSFEDNEKILLYIESKIELLLEKFKIDSFSYNIVSSNVDSYLGTVDNILSKLSKLLRTAQDEKKTLLMEITYSDVDDFDDMQDIVNEVIEQEKIDINFTNKTMSLASGNIIIQEVRASITYNNQDIYIGVFLSTLNHLGEGSLFDKIVIQKVIKYLEKNTPQHKLVVTLSINSLLDTGFMLWLDELCETNQLKNKIIFSFTSYSISSYIEPLKSFVGKMKVYGVECMIVRYSYNELALEKLETIGIKYIRLHNDFLNKFLSKSPISVNIMQHIMISSSLNQFEILTDKVDKSHIAYLKSIGILGVIE